MTNLFGIEKGWSQKMRVIWCKHGSKFLSKICALEIHPQQIIQAIYIVTAGRSLMLSAIIGLMVFFHGLNCAWEHTNLCCSRLKSICFVKLVESLIIGQIILAHTFDLSHSTVNKVRPNMRNPPSEPESGEIKEFSPPSDTKAPFCRQGSNRYFVNGLNDSTQMIDGADGAFAVFPQYQAHTHTCL